MVAVLAATLVVGAAVQGLVGLGLVAAPVVTLLEPALMPDLLLWLALLLPLVTLVREHHEIDWPRLGWSMSLVVPATRTSLVAAGVVSGVTGTATSIGGPPMLILLQHRSPHQIRSTLGVYFIGGAAMSLLGLGVAGALERSTFVLAMLLVPCLVVGFALSRVLARRLPRHQVRNGCSSCARPRRPLLVRSLV